MRRKRYEFPAPVLDRRSFADRSGCAPSVRRQTVRVGGRPICRPASVSSGWTWPRAAVRWVVFPKLSKLLSQESALGAPCLDGLLHRTSGWQALMLSRWWAARARVERMGARPNRAVVVKTALTCGYYSHSSTVLETRRELIHNSLVTITARCAGASREFGFRGDAGLTKQPPMNGNKGANGDCSSVPHHPISHSLFKTFEVVLIDVANICVVVYIYQHAF
jgi:hypothetical protein